MIKSQAESDITTCVSVEDCETRHKQTVWVLGIVFTVVGLLMGGIGWSLTSSWGAQTASLQFAADLSTHKAVQAVSDRRLEELLTALEQRAFENKAEIKEIRSLVEQIARKINVSSSAP